MKISVRIVGIYFRKEVEVPENSTVWEVTKAAEIASQGKLRIQGSYSIEKVEHDTNPTLAESPSHVDRKSGTYALAEDKSIRARALVWQYYIQRPTGNFGGPSGDIPLYETISADGKAIFASAARGLQEGDQIMWRLIVVGLDPLGPVSPEPRARLT